MNEKADLAERIDNILDWAYPLIYVVAFGVVIWLYFGVPTDIAPPA
jgi:cytosine/uracil/thiamine/allantoin permease